MPDPVISLTVSEDKGGNASTLLAPLGLLDKDAPQLFIKINRAPFAVFRFTDFKTDDSLVEVYLAPSQRRDLGETPTDLVGECHKPLEVIGEKISDCEEIPMLKEPLAGVIFLKHRDIGNLVYLGRSLPSPQAEDSFQCCQFSVGRGARRPVLDSCLDIGLYPRGRDFRGSEA